MFCLDGMCYALASGWLVLVLVLFGAAVGYVLRDMGPRS
jgi:hypothetical protein